MDYRQLPRGGEKLSTIGIGTSYTHLMTRDEIIEMYTYAHEHGVNIIDFLSHREGVSEAIAEAVRPVRKDWFLQTHCGVHYPNSQYTKNRDPEVTKRMIEYDLKLLDTDYLDVAFIGNVDEPDDFEAVMKKGGIWDYMQKLKEEGVARRLGFSSHRVDMSNRLLDMDCFDMFMLSSSPVEDYAEAYGRHSFVENGKIAFRTDRGELFKRCAAEGVGITCMKTFFGGKLLKADPTLLNIKLTPYQCIKYNLDRPGVLSCMAGVANLDELKNLIEYYNTPDSEKQYSEVLGSMKMDEMMQNCIYCDHCQPCSANIEIAMVNKFMDLAKMNDTDALDHYKTLKYHASDCVECGECNGRCPFKLSPQKKIAEAHEYFGY